MSGPPRALLIAGRALVAAAAVVVLGGYLVRAAALVAYPWDWGPDEGLFIDHGRRITQGLGTLYERSAVPFPAAYGPGLPLLLAPVAAREQPLAGARLVALLWTTLAAAAVFVPVRRAAGPWLALACAALSLAPFDATYWWMLVRVDGPMTALWLLAGGVLLPTRLERGADALGPGRALLGAGLLVSAALFKPTAVAHAAPLVAGWALVDRRSALRLAAGSVVLGLGALLVLQLATGGGFLWVSGLWRLHRVMPGQGWVLLRHFLLLAWPLLLAAAVVLVAVGPRWREAGREGALLLVLGGLVMVPGLWKYGAMWNYLLPLVPCLALLAGRWAALLSPRASSGAAAGIALTALLTALGRPFPLPSPADERTAAQLYAFVRTEASGQGAPILASWPEYAYVVAGQPVEIEGSSFPELVRHRVAGTGLVLERLRAARYGLVLHGFPLPAEPPWVEALFASYVKVGTCRLGYHYGPLEVDLWVRRPALRPFVPAEGARCRADAPNAP